MCPIIKGYAGQKLYTHWQYAMNTKVYQLCRQNISNYWDQSTTVTVTTPSVKLMLIHVANYTQIITLSNNVWKTYKICGCGQYVTSFAAVCFQGLTLSFLFVPLIAEGNHLGRESLSPRSTILLHMLATNSTNGSSQFLCESVVNGWKICCLTKFSGGLIAKLLWSGKHIKNATYVNYMGNFVITLLWLLRHENILSSGLN
jgi:hypothetical protein